jgi:hypothetical protein
MAARMKIEMTDPKEKVGVLDFTMQLAAALIGGCVFSLGVGAFVVGVLRVAGVNSWLVFLIFPLSLIGISAVSLFLRPFFMRFAVPIVALLADQLDSTNYTVSQGLFFGVFLASIFALLVFAFVPDFILLGLGGAFGFTIYSLWSKSLHFDSQGERAARNRVMK